MSMFEFCTYSFPGINKASIRKISLVVNHGGGLQFKMIAGHVDHIVDWFPNGFTLSRARSGLKFQGFTTKFGQMASM